MLTFEKEQELFANGFRRTRHDDFQGWSHASPERLVVELPWIREDMPYSVPYLNSNNVVDMIRKHDQHRATMQV